MHRNRIATASRLHHHLATTIIIQPGLKSGKLGELVVSRNRAGQYLRKWGKQIDQKTPRQEANRAIMASMPGFSGTTKSEYHAPREDLVLDTLREIEKLGASKDPFELNVYKAVWCALGFGLRKRHIAGAKVGDFHKEGGDVFFRPASNGGKNHSEIGVQLDAWERLAPHVEGRNKSEYLLTGTDTERQDEVFRRLSLLFKSLDWETQHHIHELRAWAGCRIVAGPDGKSENWEAGRRFLKHRFTHTTQNFYGHHFQAKIAKVSLPSLALPESKIIPVPKQAAAR